MSKEFTELTWGALKEAINAIASDDDRVFSIRQINPGTMLEDLDIGIIEGEGLDID